MNTKWLIWSTEHQAWWKPNQFGYTRNIEKAGHYSYNEAVKICKSANNFVTDESGTTEPEELMLPVEDLDF